MVKKLTAIILLVLCLSFALAACGQPQQAPDRELAPEQPQEEKAESDEFVEVIADSKVPTASSDDIELYLVEETNGYAYVVNRYG